MDTLKVCPHGQWFTGGHESPHRPDQRPDTATQIYRDDDRPFYDPHEYKTRIMDGVIEAYIRNHHKGSLSPKMLVNLFDVYQKDGQEDMAIACLAAYDKAEKAAEPLGLSASPNCHKSPPPPRRHGQKGISAKSKREVMSSVGYLLSTFDRLCLTFGTVTVPALAAEEMEHLARDFAIVLKRFMQEVSRELKRAGLPDHFIAVVELQENRWEKWGQVVPHVHFLCVGRAWRNHAWALSKEWMDETWARILENFLGHPVSTKSCCRVEVPKSSLRGELGKYLSKGGKILESIKEAGKGDLLPKQWTSRSRGLAALVKQARIHLKGEQATWIDRHLPELRAEGLLTFWWVERPVVDRVTGEITKQICGYAGRFTSKQAMQTVLDRAAQGDKAPILVPSQDKCA